MGRSHAVLLAEEGADLDPGGHLRVVAEIGVHPLDAGGSPTTALPGRGARLAVTHVVDIRDAAVLTLPVADGLTSSVV